VYVIDLEEESHIYSGVIFEGGHSPVLMEKILQKQRQRGEMGRGQSEGKERERLWGPLLHSFKTTWMAILYLTTCVWLPLQSNKC